MKRERKVNTPRGRWKRKYGGQIAILSQLNTKEEHMAVKVRIPTPLRKLTNGLDEVSVNGATVSAVLEDLERQYPGIKERICEGDGKLRKFVNLYLNDEDIRFKENLSTAVKESDELSIVPAIAGGRFEKEGISYVSQGPCKGGPHIRGREKIQCRD